MRGVRPGATRRSDHLVEIADAHDGELAAVAVVDDFDGAPLILTAGADGAVHGFRLSATSRSDHLFELRLPRQPACVAAVSASEIALGFTDGAVLSFKFV